MPTTYWSSVVQPPPLTFAGCAAPLCQTKKAILFVCLLWLFLPVTVCVLSLSLSLMACTWWFQLILTSFGWHVIPAGHCPQKSLSKIPRIGFFPLPTAKPCPLTHDPPLPILARYKLVVPGSRACFTFFVCCSCICHDLEIGLVRSAMHFWLLMAWVVF